MQLQPDASQTKGNFQMDGDCEARYIHRSGMCSNISLFRLKIKALRAFFPKLKKDDAKAEFSAVYKREAEEHDREFAKKYDEDLNTTLIFVRTFLHWKLLLLTIRRHLGGSILCSHYGFCDRRSE